MKSLKFEWDPAKASSNVKKHGVSFEEARTVFDDDFARMLQDPDHSQEEEVYLTGDELYPENFNGRSLLSR